MMATLHIVKDRAPERAAMTVYRAAMRKALAMIPHGNQTALDVANDVAASPQTPISAKIAWADVIQFERMNPDIAHWAPMLVAEFAPGADPDLVIDAIFRLAMSIEARDGQETARLLDLVGLIGS